MFPLSPERHLVGDHWRRLVNYLPPYDAALVLTQLERMADGHFVVPITPSQIQEDLLPKFYPSQRSIPPSALRKSDLHDLALLFAILAAECQGCRQLQLRHANVKTYTQLCRAALAFSGVLEDSSLSAVQAILILVRNIWSSGLPNRRILADKMIVLAFQMAISVSPNGLSSVY